MDEKEILAGIVAVLQDLHPEVPVIVDGQAPENGAFLQIVPGIFKQEQKLDNRYRREQTYQICYTPQEGEEKVERCNDMSASLWLGLEYVPMGGYWVRGEEMKREIQEGVMQFSVTYKWFVRKIKPEAPKMEALFMDPQTKTREGSQS